MSNPPSPPLFNKWRPSEPNLLMKTRQSRISEAVFSIPTAKNLPPETQNRPGV